MKLKITYRKSSIGYSRDQKATVRSLGLRKLNSTVVHDDSPTVRGMIFKVKHLVSVEEITGETTLTGDDLTRIEGIGPKISRTLLDAGVTTFAQLAALTPEQISEMLRAAKIRLAATDSWPEQARLAAAGQWDDLKALQEQLVAGRQA